MFVCGARLLDFHCLGGFGFLECNHCHSIHSATAVYRHGSEMDIL